MKNSDNGENNKIILEVNPDIVCQIILRAKEFHAKEAVNIPIPEDELSEEQLLQILEDHQHDRTFCELKRAINDLEDIQQASLVALMYLGRGDYLVSEWEEALHFANENLTSFTTEYLLSHPLVANFLEEGLNLLGYSCDI